MDHVAFAILACALVGAAAFLAIRLVVGRRPVDDGAAYRPPILEARRQQAIEDSAVFRLLWESLPSVTPIVRQLPLQRLGAALDRAHRAAGAPLGLVDDELVACGLIAGGLLSALSVFALLAVGAGPAAVAGLIMLPIGPLALWWSHRRTAHDRQLEIWRTLPYAYDLIAMTLRSGAPFLHALRRVSTDYADNLIGQSFGHTVTELEMGVARRQAFERLAQRIGLPEFDHFVDTILRAEELGRPLADTVEHLSVRLRTHRMQSVSKKAGVASVIVFLPAAMILVANMIVLLGPFVLRMFSTFDGSGGGAF